MKKDNNEKSFPIINIIFSTILCMVIIILCFFLAHFILMKAIEALVYIYHKLTKMDAVVAVALITGAFSIVAVCISTIMGNIISANNTKREYLTKQREKPYEDFVQMIYKLQMSTKLGHEYSEQEMLEDISKVSKQITLWGSDNVVNNWVEFRENSIDKENAIKNLFLLEKIMNNMREDLGVKKVKAGNLLAFFVNDIKNYTKNNK